MSLYFSKSFCMFFGGVVCLLTSVPKYVLVCKFSKFLAFACAQLMKVGSLLP